MIITTFEEAKQNLIGERISIENESTLTIFSEVTSIISAIEALENPEIRNGAKDNLLYVVGGNLEKTEENEHSDKIQMYIYPDTKVETLLNCLDFNF